VDFLLLLRRKKMCQLKNLIHKHAITLRFMTWFIFPIWSSTTKNKETNNKWAFHYRSLAFRDNINLQLKSTLALHLSYPKRRISAKIIDIDENFNNPNETSEHRYKNLTCIEIVTHLFLSKSLCYSWSNGPKHECAKLFSTCSSFSAIRRIFQLIHSYWKNTPT